MLEDRGQPPAVDLAADGRTGRERRDAVLVGRTASAVDHLGLANSFAAYEAGVRIIDGAVGGLGGCPFAPGASGNTSTEDLVFMFEEMGVKTGIDLKLLFEVGRYFQSMKQDVCYTRSLLKAGVPAPQGAIRKDGAPQKWNI